MKNPSNSQIIERIVKLEVKVDGIQKELDEIKDNHLKQIYNRLENIEKKFYSILAWAGIGAFLGSIIIQFFLRYFLK